MPPDRGPSAGPAMVTDVVPLSRERTPVRHRRQRATTGGGITWLPAEQCLGRFCRPRRSASWTRSSGRSIRRNARLAEETLKAGGPFPQRCPRRDEMFQQGGAADEMPDAWEYGHGLVTGDDLHILTCNYCGSAHPDFFMEKVRDEGWTWGATDKNYKAYLGTPDGHTVAKFYFQHLSVEQRHEVVELINANRIKFGPSGLYRLPFFMTRAS